MVKHLLTYHKINEPRYFQLQYSSLPNYLFTARRRFPLFTFFAFIIIVCSAFSLLLFSKRFSTNRNLKLISLNTTMDILDYFIDCDGDGFNIRWAHAVNNLSKLNETLEFPRVHMIESDIILRGMYENLDTVGGNNTPIMAHPPADDSDLTFEHWLSSIIAYKNRKIGAKADFKSLPAAEASLKIIFSKGENIDFPLWLNADIFDGGGSNRPIDAKEFLKLCSRYGPGLTLSLGWTTPQRVDDRRQSGYEWSHVRGMYDEILSFFNSSLDLKIPPITFAVRASLIRGSLPRLFWLLENLPKELRQDQNRFSVTVWTSNRDYLSAEDYKAIIDMRNVLGKRRVFVDLPEVDMAMLRDFLNESTTNLSLFNEIGKEMRNGE